MKTFESTFTAVNITEAAQSILKSIDDKDTQIDYDFSFQQGEFVSDDINTWIRFDTNNYPLLKEMLGVLTNEKIEPTKKRIKLFAKFREDVCKLLVKEFKEVIADKLRNCVFGSKINAKICPIENIKITDFDLADIPDSARYLLVVKKEQPKDVISPSVSKDLYDYLYTLDDGELNKKEIEEKLNEFISEKRNSDSKFKYITKVTLKKAFFECQVELFADYTMVRPEDIDSSGGIKDIPDF